MGVKTGLEQFGPPAADALRMNAAVVSGSYVRESSPSHASAKPCGAGTTTTPLDADQASYLVRGVCLWSKEWGVLECIFHVESWVCVCVCVCTL
jgi:hypothetical protein